MLHTDVPSDQMNAHLIAIEGVLSRVDSATTYYQVLGVDRSAGQQEIKAAFQLLVDVLFMQYAISRNIPGEMIPQIDRTFNRGCQAFATLASFAKRREYDTALAFIASKPQSKDQTARQKVVLPGVRLSTNQMPPDRDRGAAPAMISTDRVGRQASAYAESARAAASDNRRRCARMKLTIPARVTGHDQQHGKWNEMTETIDVSRTGVKVRLRRKVKHGMVLHVTLPLPPKLRSHGFSESTYSVYTFVRRVEPSRHGVRAVGLEFVGENPPPGYLEKPWTVFRVKRWGGGDRRRPDRIERVEPVRLEYFDDGMQSLCTEHAKTENISRSGVRIVCQAAPPDFDFVLVTSERLRFEALAAVRNRFMGKDGRERLSLQLIDKEWPGLSERGD